MANQLDLIDGDYFKNIPLSQQDQFVDNRNTLGQKSYSGNTHNDRLNQMLKDQGLVDVSVMISPGAVQGLAKIASGLSGRALTKGANVEDISTLLKADREINRQKWAKDSDPFLLNPDGTPKTFYRGTRSDPGVNYKGRSEARSKPEYYGNDLYEGNNFYTTNPKFADDFAKSIDIFATKQPRISPNVAPVNLNNRKLFNPNNRTHSDEYSNFLHKNIDNPKFKYDKDSMFPGDPMYSKDDIASIMNDMRHTERGWEASEMPMIHEFIRSKGNNFDGAMVLENGERNIMSIPGNNVKSIFNSGHYKDPNNIMRTAVPVAGLGLSSQYLKDKKD